MYSSYLRITGLLLVVLVMAGCSKPEMTDSQGNGLSLKDSGGRWLVINFWADWCDPCREEIPELNALERKGAIRVLGVDFDASKGKELEQKAASLKIDFPVLSDSPLALLKAKAPQVLPATYVVNPNGQLVDTLYGPQTQISLENRVKKLQKSAKEQGADG